MSSRIKAGKPNPLPVKPKGNPIAAVPKRLPQLNVLCQRRIHRLVSRTHRKQPLDVLGLLFQPEASVIACHYKRHVPRRAWEAGPRVVQVPQVQRQLPQQPLKFAKRQKVEPLPEVHLVVVLQLEHAPRQPGFQEAP